MPNPTFRAADKIGLIVVSTFLITLTGCMNERSTRYSGYHGNRSSGHMQVAVNFQDDYDYYPGYETYYSRNRREYVYRHNNRWVRQSEPSGVSLTVLLSSPSVRLDFHDSPERHHEQVTRSYPRNWTPPGQSRNDHDGDRDDGDRRDRNDNRND